MAIQNANNAGRTGGGITPDIDIDLSKLKFDLPDVSWSDVNDSKISGESADTWAPSQPYQEPAGPAEDTQYDQPAGPYNQSVGQLNMPSVQKRQTPQDLLAGGATPVFRGDGTKPSAMDVLWENTKGTYDEPAGPPAQLKTSRARRNTQDIIAGGAVPLYTDEGEEARKKKEQHANELLNMGMYNGRIKDILSSAASAAHRNGPTKIIDKEQDRTEPPIKMSQLPRYKEQGPVGPSAPLPEANLDSLKNQLPRFTRTPMVDKATPEMTQLPYYKEQGYVGPQFPLPNAPLTELNSQLENSMRPDLSTIIANGPASYDLMYDLGPVGPDEKLKRQHATPLSSEGNTQGFMDIGPAFNGFTPQMPSRLNIVQDMIANPERVYTDAALLMHTTSGPETEGPQPPDNFIKDRIGFATDSRGTAFDTETGDYVQTPPPDMDSRFVDDLPGMDQNVSDWLQQYRASRASQAMEYAGMDPDTVRAWELLNNDPSKMTSDDWKRIKVADENKARSYEANIKRDYTLGFFPVEDETVDSHGRVTYSPRVERALGVIGARLGLNTDTELGDIFRIIRLNMGLTTDSNDQMFKKDNDQAFVFETAIEEAAQRILDSMDDYGHPFAYTSSNDTLHVGSDIPRIPVAVMDDRIAFAVAQATGKSMEEVKENAKNDSLIALKKAVEVSKKFNDGGKVLNSYKAQVRALCDLTGQDPLDYGVTPMGSAGLENALTDAIEFTDLIPDEVAANVSEERMNRAIENWKKRAESGAKRGKNGELTTSALDDYISFGMSALRVARIAGNVPLAVTAAVEHGVGNLEVNAANRLMFALGDSRYKPTKELYDAVSTEDNVERFTSFKLLQRIGGRDAILAFSQTGKPWTENNVQAFINESQPESSHPKLREWQQKLQKLSDTLMPGDIQFQASDTKRWMQCFMYEMMENKGMTAEEALTALTANADGFFSAAFSTYQGYQALVASSNLSANRISPATEAVRLWLQSHGVNDAIASFIFDSPYLNYAMRAVSLWAPGSNTISYFVNNAISQQTGKDFNENQLNLKKCLLYDTIKFGQTATTMLIFYGISVALGGFQPPDDPKKKLLPWEWKLAVPWADEPVPMRQSWFMDDLFQWAAPGCVALAMKDAGVPSDQIWKAFWYGVNDIFGGNKAIAAVGSVLGIPGTIQDIWEGEVQPDQWLTKKLMKTINTITSPMGITQITDMMHNDDFMRDARYDQYGRYRNKIEAMYNQYALNNPMMAALGNFASGLFSGNWNRFGWNNSGLKYDPDELGDMLSSANSYKHFLVTSGIWEDSEEAKGAYASSILSKIEAAESADDLIASGFLLTADDCYLVKDWIQAQIEDLVDQDTKLAAAYGSGQINSNSYWPQYNAIKAQKQYYFDALDAMAYDGLLYDKKAYVQVVGDTVYNPETGEYYNYGNTPGWLNLFDSPDTGQTHFRDINGNDETTWGDFATESFRNNGTQAYGRHDVPNTEANLADYYASVGLTGNKEVAATGNNEDGKSETDAFRDAVKKLKEDTNSAMSNNRETVANKSTGGGGGGGGRSYGTSYGYSSGSRSYSSGSGLASVPKVYAVNGGNLSINNPSNIYLKSPYSANNQYLSPSVSTQGSSQAYVRRD